MSRRWLLLVILCSPASAQEKAISGFDPVVYFSEGRAARGVDSLWWEFKGQRWHFVSVQNRRAFVESPDAYRPQFDGYCAYAAGHNYVYEGDPEVWTMVDGRLYLNYSREIREAWLAARDSLIREGNKHWPGLVKNKR